MKFIKKNCTNIFWVIITIMATVQPALVVLKIAGVLQWSWVWTLCLYWIGYIAIALLFALFVCDRVGIDSKQF